ncbi:S1C family serine protease [Virgibacillus byunsanensis]|uniref:S1C family serine protease n=1 Tax=Virgibacillus byunsanensis TaxID=570945 RepID=A0ABW3LM77_9BACI
MKEKRYRPITVSVLLLMIGVLGLFAIYHSWNTKEVSVTSTVVNKVKSAEKGLDLKSIIHEAEKNVMLIEGQNDQNTITGSGFLYNKKGDIITNAHVVENADVIYVRTANARIYPAAIVGMGEDTDIAVIRVPQLAGQTNLSIEKEQKAEVGDEVIALGSPHGFQNTVTLGIISGRERNFSVDGFDYKNVYQISAQITQGNSGGPLIERETGKAVGINSVGTMDGTIGFSIPLDEVIGQLEQWSNEAQNDQLDFSNTGDIISTIDPEQLQLDAEYLVDYFFESITIRDYVGAYTLLGSDIQSEISYSDFRERYIHIVDLEYAEVASNLSVESLIKITAEVNVESKLPDTEENSMDTYQYEFTIGYENDQLKVLSLTY